MKHPALTILALITCLCQLISASEPANMNNSPAKLAADAFITKLNQTKPLQIDLATETAISPYIPAYKKRRIYGRLKRQVNSYFMDGDTITFDWLVDTENYAAVSYQVRNPLNPQHLHIITVAMCKTTKGWLPAPQLGSFQNIYNGYSEQLSDELDQLSQSLQKNTNKRQPSLREDASKQFQRSVAEYRQQLAETPPKELAKQFLNYCRNQQLAGALACLNPMGSSRLNQNAWREIHRATASAIAGSHKINKWEIITSPPAGSVQVVDFSETQSQVTLYHWNPLLASSPPEVLNFSVDQMQPPYFLELPVPLMHEGYEYADDHSAEEHQSANFYQLLNKQSQYQPLDSLDDAIDKLQNAIKTNDFKSYLQLVAPELRLEQKNKQILINTLKVSWRNAIGQSSLPIDSTHSPLPAKTCLTRNAAIAYTAPAIIDLANSKNIHTSYWLQIDGHWSLVPSSQRFTREINKSLDEDELSKFNVLASTSKSEFKKQLNKYQLLNIQQVDWQETATAPSNQEAKDHTNKYLKLLSEANTNEILQNSLLICPEDDSAPLTQIKYAIQGSQLTKKIGIPDEILATSSNGRWHAVSLKTHTTAEQADYPMMLITTHHGKTKTVIDFKVKYITHLGIQLRNNSNWKKLEENIPAEELERIRELFDKHIKLAESDYKANQDD